MTKQSAYVYLVLALAVLQSTVTQALAKEPLAEDFRCFATSDAKPIKLEFRMFHDPNTNWRGGYIRYGNSANVIPVVPLSSETGDRDNQEPPLETKEIWGEIDNGKITGEYRVSYQGANFTSFKYQNFKNGKHYSFEQINDTWTETGCVWK